MDNKKINNQLNNNDKSKILTFVLIILFAICVLTYIFVTNTKKIQKSKQERIYAQEKKKIIKDKEEKIDRALDIANRIDKVENLQKKDYIEFAKYQFKEPEKGDSILEVKLTNSKVIKIKLFREYTQNAYNDLQKAINKKIYIGSKVLDNKYNGSVLFGKGNDVDVWSVGYNREVHQKLVPYYASVIIKTKNTQSDILGSDFRIITEKFNETEKNNLIKAKYPESLIKAYEQYGGLIFDEYLYSAVIGQVVEGMDEIEKIVNSDEYKNIKIEAMNIYDYER